MCVCVHLPWRSCAHFKERYTKGKYPIVFHCRWGVGELGVLRANGRKMCGRRLDSHGIHNLYFALVSGVVRTGMRSFICYETGGNELLSMLEICSGVFRDRSKDDESARLLSR